MAWASPTTVSTQPSGGSPQVIPSSSKRTGEHPSAKGKRLPSSGPPRKNPRPGQAGHSPQPGTFGHRYWRFNEETQRGDPGYPKPISVWQGIPASPKGAFLSNDAGTRASPCPAFTIPRLHTHGTGLACGHQHQDGRHGGPSWARRPLTLFTEAKESLSKGPQIAQ